MTSLLLVHGLWHDAGTWEPLRAALARRGVPAGDVHALDLPMRTLDGDAAAVRAVLDGLPGDVVLVGHSYGGAVVTVAGEHPSVTRLVYLAAFLLDDGESISRVAPSAGVPDTGLGAALHIQGDDVTIDPQRARELLYHRTPAGLADAALARLRPAGRALFSARPSTLAWRTRPSTYAICTDDRTVAPQLQRIMAGRATDHVEWDSDHSPQTSRPDDVADLLLDRQRRRSEAV